jgi:hypothetical protein
VSTPSLYSRPVIINARAHATWRVDKPASYMYAKRIGAVWLNMQEFAAAGQEFPIVFMRDDAGFHAAGLLGVRSDENLFVEADGQWLGHYVPAYVRRYPYTLTSAQPGQTPELLCVESAYEGLNRSERGKPLFDEKGQPSDYLLDVAAFAEQYEKDRATTAAFCQRLGELGLLHPVAADIDLFGGQHFAVGPYYIVDRPALDTLSDSVLGELVRNRAMDAIMAHLHSQISFRRLAELAGESH